MPELPEVEYFRQVLLPLVSKTERLNITAVNDNPPRKWLSEDQVYAISDRYHCARVLRKGKLLCMVLGGEGEVEEKYLYLHMGMTGSIISPDKVCRWGSNKTARGAEGSFSFPPPYTYLTFQAGSYKAAFSDPRKFGSCELCEDVKPFESLAPDGLETKDEETIREIILPNLIDQTLGIKALLLDQKRALSGAGNWVVDEVLYQCEMHPDQSHLSKHDAQRLFQTLQSILGTAVECLIDDQEYPDDWLFPYRWTKKRQGKDSKGRNITFLKSGGRTSAIIASAQKLIKGNRKQKSTPGGKANSTSTKSKSKIKQEKEQDKVNSTKSKIKEENGQKNTPAGKANYTKSNNKEEKGKSTREEDQSVKRKSTTRSTSTSTPVSAQTNIDLGKPKRKMARNNLSLAPQEAVVLDYSGLRRSPRLVSP